MSLLSAVPTAQTRMTSSRFFPVPKKRLFKKLDVNELMLGHLSTAPFFTYTSPTTISSNITAVRPMPLAEAMGSMLTQQNWKALGGQHLGGHKLSGQQAHYDGVDAPELDGHGDGHGVDPAVTVPGNHQNQQSESNEPDPPLRRSKRNQSKQRKGNDGGQSTNASDQRASRGQRDY